MMMATTLRHLDQLLHTVERGRALNVDELGRLPVRLYGPDGQPLFTEQNPAHVKGEVTLTGSEIQVPIDLQSHGLTPGMALPIYNTDPYVSEELILTQHVVAPSPNGVTVWTGPTNAPFLAIGVIAQQSHEYGVKALWFRAGASTGDPYGDTWDDRFEILPIDTRKNVVSEPFMVVTPRIRLFLYNLSGVDQTYDVYLYRLKGGR